MPESSLGSTAASLLLVCNAQSWMKDVEQPGQGSLSASLKTWGLKQPSGPSGVMPEGVGKCNHHFHHGLVSRLAGLEGQWDMRLNSDLFP